MDTSDWIAVDWTGSEFRFWVLDGTGALRDQGRARVAPDAPYELTLAAQIAHTLADDAPTEIWITGRPVAPGARPADDLAPVDLATVPHDPPGPGDARRATAVDARLDLRLIPGLQQARPEGVLLREAVYLRGILATDPKFDGVVVVLGATNHWIHISAGEVVSFASAATGQILQSLGADEPGVDPDPEVLSNTLARPETLATQLGAAGAHAELTGELDPKAARIFGACLGAELAATRPYWLGQRVHLVGRGPRVDAYARGLESQGVIAETSDEEAVLLAGFRAIHG